MMINIYYHYTDQIIIKFDGNIYYQMMKFEILSNLKMEAFLQLDELKQYDLALI